MLRRRPEIDLSKPVYQEPEEPRDARDWVGAALKHLADVVKIALGVFLALYLMDKVWSHQITSAMERANMSLPPMPTFRH